MNNLFNFNLKRIWLLIGILSLILPIFMPSTTNPRDFFENAIGTLTVTMFILTFPCSLFGLIILFFAKALLDVNPNSIESLYLNLFILFVMGLVQWFWLAPRLMRNEPAFQILNLRNSNGEIQFSETGSLNDAKFHQLQEFSPLERVFQESDSEQYVSNTRTRSALRKLFTAKTRRRREIQKR